jgi:UDP-GlcNAc:undecaprenyl-phosphate GlcNAc-1-phosphate transferase
MEGAVIALSGAAAALVLTPVAARVARRTGIVDRPGALKVQEHPVPYLGGAAVFAAVAIASVVGGARLSWLVPLGLALALGLADDVAAVSPRSRLLGEVVIGGIAGVVAPGPGPAGGLLMAVAVVGLINAVNLLDGLDGLAAGVVLVSSAGFAALGGPGRPFALGLAAALAGFLVFNRAPARIYLGDAGAYLLGCALAMLAAAALRDEPEPVYWGIVPLLVAVPLGDTAIAIVRRVRARRPIFSGDRSHVYDQLVDRGRSRQQAVGLCVAAQALLVAVGVLAWNVPDAFGAALSIGTVVVLVVAVRVMGFVTPMERS